jgi:hypothetical protein
MTAASERVRDCWDRACNLAGFKGAGSVDPRSIGAQIDSTVEVLFGAERVAVQALLMRAWEIVSSPGDEENAAECLKLAATMVEQRGRVLGALKAAQAVEDVVWPEDAGSQPELCGLKGLRARDGARQRIVHAMTDNGFGPQEPKSVFDAPSKLGPCSGCDSRGECAEWCPGLRAEPAVQS